MGLGEGKEVRWGTGNAYAMRSYTRRTRSAQRAKEVRNSITRWEKREGAPVKQKRQISRGKDAFLRKGRMDESFKNPRGRVTLLTKSFSLEYFGHPGEIVPTKLHGAGRLRD
jgi:hypothetical protein